MKGLLIKDFMAIKSQAKVYAVALAIYLVLGVIQKNAMLFNTMTLLMPLFIPLSAMAYDERAKWDSFALTMPVSRDSLVYSKYLLAVLTTVVCALLSVLVGNFVSDEPESNAAVVTALVFVETLVFSLWFPFIFKLGVEKGRIVMMVILLGPSALIYFLPQLRVELAAGIASPAEFFKYLWAAPIISLVFLLISISISVRIYRKKEF